MEADRLLLASVLLPLAQLLSQRQPKVLHRHVHDEIGVARIAAIDEASMPPERAEI